MYSTTTVSPASNALGSVILPSENPSIHPLNESLRGAIDMGQQKQSDDKNAVRDIFMNDAIHGVLNVNQSEYRECSTGKSEIGETKEATC
jgi:hypothetical protein